MPITVYIVPDPLGQLERATILAPPNLIEQLQQILQSSSGINRPILLEAEYEGRGGADAAEFTARFQVQAFSDNPADVVLRLPGIVLAQATVDGVAALPRANGGEFAIPVAGRGVHTVGLSFVVAYPAGSDGEILFTVPEIPVSRLSFLAPIGASDIRALQWRGGQQTSGAADGVRLEADLGRIGAVHIRWTRASKINREPVKVQETYLWDLGEQSARLLADWQFSIPGETKELSIELPPEVNLTSEGSPTL